MKTLSPWRMILLCALFFLTKPTFSQLTISNQGGSLNAILSAFIGNGLIISNPVINCPSNAYGTYSGGSPFNLSNGVVLTTGNVNQVSGPASSFMSTSNGTTCNDPQLLTLEPSATNDCCILEFDVIPQCDELSIRFVFGSEEYPDYVNQSFNDAFGFFITGPKPSGGSYTNQNIAIVTGTTICSIDNVNAASNSTYYVNNTGGTTLPFGGYTTAITSTLSVVPCQSYHFKMAIADASDDMFDSGVFIDLFECSSLISATLAATPDNCATNTGSATVSVANSLGPLTYVWSPSPGGGQGTTTATGLSAGVSYTCTVSDTYACIPDTSATITIPGNPIPTTIASSNAPICGGVDLNLMASNSGVSGSTYAWTGPNGFTSNVQNPIINAASTAASGTYTVTVTANGCSSFSTVNVVVNPVPVMNPISNIVVCPSVTVPGTSYNSTPAGSSFTWTNNNVAIGLGASGSGNTPSFTSINSTSNTISGTISVIPTLNGCSGNAFQYTITINPIPTVNTVSDRVECSNTLIPTVVYSSTPNGATYTWTNDNSSIGLGANGNGNLPSFTTSNTTNGAIVGNISVVPVLNGCMGNPFVHSITVNPVPVVDPISNVIECAGTLIAASNFSSTPTGANFVWTNSNSSIGLSTGGTGDYGAFTANNSSSSTVTSTISVTPSLNGCAGSALNYTIQINPIPTINVNSPTICPGETVTLTASGGTTYLWDSGENSPSISVNPTVTTTYSVTGTNLGCTSPATSTVTVENEITLTVNSPSICEGESVVLYVQGATNYLWDNGEVTDSIVVSPVTTTTYNVSGITGSCSGNTTSTVTVNPLPYIDPVSSLVSCAGDVVPSPSLLLSSNDISYVWTNSNTSIGLGDAGVDLIPYFTGSNGTQNPINGIITITPSLNGCEGEPISYQITINPIQNSAFNVTSYCEGQAVAPTVIGDMGGVFSFGGIVTDGATIDPATGVIYNGIGGSSYTIEYLVNGACPDSSQLQVLIFPYPQEPFVSGGAFCHNALPEMIEVSGGTGEFYWYDDSSLDTPIYIGTNFSPESLTVGENYYYVTENQNGCVSQQTEVLILIENCSISIPTAFTPNYDGIHDQWDIENLDLYFPNNKVSIYNRWGALIFQSEEGKYNLKPWDGKFNEEPMPVASYYFIIDFNDGKTKTETGTVSIVKK
jgi:gliding motility-associated-like protein